MEHKDIDRLFQEKLKDIEVTPNPKVWNAIEKKLKKKKRRVLPFWWFSGGVAAVFVLGFFFLFKDNSKQDSDKFPVITTKEVIKNKDEITFPSNETEVVKKIEKSDKKDKVFINKASNTKQTVVTLDKKEPIKKNKENNTNFHQNNNKILNLVDSKVAETNKSNNSEGVILKGITSFDEITIKGKTEIINLKNTEKGKSNDSEGGILKGITSSDEIAIDEKLEITDLKITEKEKTNDSKSEILKEITSSDEIVSKDNSDTLKKDFIATMNEEKEPFKKEGTKEKWGISPVVGILKSNSFSDTSSLDSNLNDNDFSGENTFSYGINVTYQIHEKWAFKSGVQLQKTGFITNDVTLSSSASSVANTLENVSFGLNDTSNSNGDQVDLSLDSGSEQEEGETEQGNLQQNYSYIEIPLEVKYTFFSSNKINTSVVSGFSSLILNENNVIGESSSLNTTIGGANNLNTLNFSGNLGLDFDIKLSEKLNLNINPMFKTQLNTFSRNSNGFKPYNIGVYSGIRYNF